MGLLNRLFGGMLDRRIAAYQQDLIAKHFEEVQHMYNQMRGWRHDYHNHIQTMKAHLALAQTSELDDYLNQLDSDLSAIDTVIQTGNVRVDAILNSKLSLIATKRIAVHAKAVVPSRLRISEIDLCVIIGNLLDNAMEACLKQPVSSSRFIRVYIGLLKQQLYISVTNSVDGEVIRSGKSFLTSKDNAWHGFGLMRIDRIADKYNGYVNRQTEEGVFATEIMLPL